MTEVPNIGSEQPISDVQPEPKVMQQHEITALVSGEKKKAYEKGRQEAKAELMAQMQSKAADTSHESLAPSDSESRLRQIAIDELSKQRAAEEERWISQQKEIAGTRILNELTTKANAAKHKFEDFENVVDPKFGNFAKSPEVLLIANNFDNAGEMLYDLGKHPTKVWQLANMIKDGYGDTAFSEMKKLSESIKLNEMSANQPKPKSPLSQVSPSTVGVGKVDDKVGSNRFRGNY